MADVTLGAGVEALRSYIMLGAGDETCWNALVKGLSGDIVLKCTPETAGQAATAEAWSKEVVVSLETADGEVHTWYNGPVTLAIADTSTAGTASINPATGSRMMTDGRLTVTVSGNAAAWLAAETATLTASINDQDPGGGTTDKAILGYAVADATCVITVA